MPKTQTKPNQTEPIQTKPNQTLNIDNLHHMLTPGMFWGVFNRNIYVLICLFVAVVVFD